MIHHIEGREPSTEEMLEHRLAHSNGRIWWECRKPGGAWTALAGMGPHGNALVGEGVCGLGIEAHTLHKRLFKRAVQS